MNENVKKVLFGNQRQALKQNEAIVNFIESYMMPTDLSTDVAVKEAILKNIEKLVDKIDKGGKLENLEDKLFLEYILGVNGREILESHVPCEICTNYVGDHGKIAFYLNPLANVGDVKTNPMALLKATRNAETHYGSVNMKHKTAGEAEDAAWDLVQRIVRDIPPAKRSELPEDDALAAILCSKEYWAVNN